jgi:hypothetical protein
MRAETGWICPGFMHAERHIVVKPGDIRMFRELWECHCTTTRPKARGFCQNPAISAFFEANPAKSVFFMVKPG